MKYKDRLTYLNIILPFVLGSLVYICWRAPSLRMFDWIDQVGLGNHCDELRDFSSVYLAGLPDWFLYSFPDGAWVWSLTAIYIHIWKYSLGREAYFWISSGLIIGLSLEFGQYFNIISGTFDVLDLLVMILSFAVASITQWRLS